MSIIDFEKHGSEYAVVPSSIRYTADRILKEMEEEFEKKAWSSDAKESVQWIKRKAWAEHLRGQPELVEVGFMLFTELGRMNTALQGAEW